MFIDTSSDMEIFFKEEWKKLASPCMTESRIARFSRYVSPFDGERILKYAKDLAEECFDFLTKRGVVNITIRMLTSTALDKILLGFESSSFSIDEMIPISSDSKVFEICTDNCWRLFVWVCSPYLEFDDDWKLSCRKVISEFYNYFGIISKNYIEYFIDHIQSIEEGKISRSQEYEALEHIKNAYGDGYVYEFFLNIMAMCYELRFYREKTDLMWSIIVYLQKWYETAFVHIPDMMSPSMPKNIKRFIQYAKKNPAESL